MSLTQALCDAIVLAERPCQRVRTDDLGVPCAELGLETCDLPELGSAYWREVVWMREQDRPAAVKPLVEADLAVRCVCAKVWCN